MLKVLHSDHGEKLNETTFYHGLTMDFQKIVSNSPSPPQTHTLVSVIEFTVANMEEIFSLRNAYSCWGFTQV